jgi:cytochrome P450/ubiquinone/menaquinone biosynthesis C-methylase UbiE
MHLERVVCSLVVRRDRQIGEWINMRSAYIKNGPSTGEPPGPRGNLLLGSIQAFRADPMTMLREVHRKYGDIVHFRLVHNHCYLFCHPDDIRYVLRTNSGNFRKAFLFDKIRVLLGNGLLPMPYEDEFWRQRRRLSQPAFHRSFLDRYAKTWVSATETFLHGWMQYARTGQVFDAFQEMYSLSFDLGARTLLSTDGQSAETDAVRAAFDVGLAHLKRKIEAIVDLPEWIPTPANRQFLEARATLDRVVYRLIEERRTARDAAQDDFLSILLRAFDERDDIDARQLRDEVMTMFIAGFETVASALAWSIWMLCTHPQWDAALREEVARVLDGSAPTLDDLPRLPLVRMVLDETMRLHPPAWWIVRSTIAADTIGGYSIPVGSLVIVSQYVTHRHPALWEDPDRFDPLRFQDERAAARPPLSFFPFGDGPRSCIGTHFAYAQMVTALVMLVQRFRWRPLSGHHVGLLASATMRPKNGVLIAIETASASPAKADASGDIADLRRPTRKESRMSGKSVLADITDPYSDVDAWLYDKLFAPAVLAMVSSELETFSSMLPTGAKVLDVGCGGGQIPLTILGHRGDVELTGIDLSHPQVKRARTRTATFGDRARFEVGSALELSVEDSSFDAVLSVTSIKHWPSPKRGLEECLRVLKPGGQLLLVEIDRGCKLDTLRTLMSASRVPRILRRAALPYLRTFIAGQAMDLDEFRELLGSLPVVGGRVARIPGQPGIVMTGRRDPQSSVMAAAR